jgi:hypothetical protein
MDNNWNIIMNTHCNDKQYERVGINIYFSRNDPKNYIVRDNIILLITGTLYNEKKLSTKEHLNPYECILDLYQKYGIMSTLPLLDGVFSFVLLDNTSMSENLYIVRDPLGICPLFENKLYHSYCCSKNVDSDWKDFTPGSFSHYQLSFSVNTRWMSVVSNKSYYTLPFYASISGGNPSCHSQYLKRAIEKRCRDFTEPVGIYLTNDEGSIPLLYLLCQLCIERNLPTSLIEIFSEENVDFDVGRLGAKLTIIPNRYAISMVKILFVSLGFFNVDNRLDTVIQYRHYLNHIHLEWPVFMPDIEVQYPYLDLDYLNYNLSIP